MQIILSATTRSRELKFVRAFASQNIIVEVRLVQFLMKKRTKILILSVLIPGLFVTAGTFFTVKKIRSPEYAYAQSIEARERGDGDAMLRWLSVAGARGDVRAQMQLAVGFETGAFGGIKDEKIAAAWYEKAAKSGDPVAQFNYGTFCWTGRGNVPADREQAFEWWKKAAENGILNAKTNLGICYRDGLGTEKDTDKARNLFIEAAAAIAHYAFAAKEKHSRIRFALGLAFACASHYRHLNSDK